MSVANLSRDLSLKALQERYSEKNKIEVQRRSRLQEEENKVRRHLQDYKHALKRHAEDLRFQISDNQERSRSHLKEMLKPGIDPKFNGFPNRPETPAAARLQRKRIMQETIRQSLEGQIESRRKRERRLKQQSLLFDREMTEKLRQEEARARQRALERKLKLREELLQAQEEAELHKQWQKRIDSEQDYSAIPQVNVLEIHATSDIEKSSDGEIELHTEPMLVENRLSTSLLDASAPVLKRKQSTSVL